MHNAVLAPSFFAPPDSNKSNWIEQWIDNLWKWSTFLQFGMTGYKSSELESVLFSEGLHPQIWITNYKQQCDEQSVEIKDVVRTYNHILQSLHEIEPELDRCGIIEIEPGAIIIEPADYENGLHPRVKNCFYHLVLAMTFILTGKGSIMAISQHETLGQKQVVIRSKVTTLSVESHGEKILERNTEAKVELVDNPDFALKFLDPVDLWTIGITNRDKNCCRFAIECNTRMLFNEAVCKDVHIQARLTRWKFGPEFFAQKDKPDIFYDPSQVKRLLRVLAEAIATESTDKAHALRIGNSGGAPPRIRQRDGAKAIRKDINLAIHLHYWERDGKGPEFANITIEHDDYYIADS